MNKPAPEFPVYRKYLTGSSYFRIDSMDAFEELRRLGSRWLIERHEVKILPDRNLVYDLVFDFSSFAVEVSESEYLTVMEGARKQ